MPDPTLTFRSGERDVLLTRHEVDLGWWEGWLVGARPRSGRLSVRCVTALRICSRFGALTYGPHEIWWSHHQPVWDEWLSALPDLQLDGTELSCAVDGEGDVEAIARVLVSLAQAFEGRTAEVTVLRAQAMEVLGSWGIRESVDKKWMWAGSLVGLSRVDLDAAREIAERVLARGYDPGVVRVAAARVIDTEAAWRSVRGLPLEDYVAMTPHGDCVEVVERAVERVGLELLEGLFGSIWAPVVDAAIEVAGRRGDGSVLSRLEELRLESGVDSDGDLYAMWHDEASRAIASIRERHGRGGMAIAVGGGELATAHDGGLTTGEGRSIANGQVVRV